MYDEQTLEIGFLSVPPLLSADQLLRSFSRAHPEVEVLFRELPFPTAGGREWLDPVDLVFCHSPAAWKGLEGRRLWSEPLAVLLQAAHPLTIRSQVAVEDVLGECFVGFDSSVDHGWASFWTLDEHRTGIPARVSGAKPRDAHEFVQAVLAGQGIGVVPLSVARTISSMVPRLAVRPLKGARPASYLILVRERATNPAARALVDTALR
jgi:DNA-binding transcriptional LysR family regulator